MTFQSSTLPSSHCPHTVSATPSAALQVHRTYCSCCWLVAQPRGLRPTCMHTSTGNSCGRTCTCPTFNNSVSPGLHLHRKGALHEAIRYDCDANMLTAASSIVMFAHGRGRLLALCTLWSAAEGPWEGTMPEGCTGGPRRTTAEVQERRCGQVQETLFVMTLGRRDEQGIVCERLWAPS